MRLKRLSFCVVVSTVTLAVWFGVSLGVGAQSPFEKPEAKMPVFSVVSVRPSGPDEKGKWKETPDGVSLHGQTMFRLIQAAYHMQEPYWVVGAPGWADKDPYDVDAKVDEADIEAMAKLTPMRRMEMLQQILEDRFKLKYHYETKELDDFALVVAKGGPNAGNLKPADPSEKPEARVKGHFVYEVKALTMENLCYMALSTESQRWVVDRTGLTGKYDFTLRWSRDEPPPADGSAAAEAVGPSIFTAVQEQLGLKLEPIKVATKILVVDSVERPSGNEK